jgi:hypothetical protein
MEEKYKKAIEKLMENLNLEWCEECEDWYDSYHKDWRHNKSN